MFIKIRILRLFLHLIFFHQVEIPSPVTPPSPNSLHTLIITPDFGADVFVACLTQAILHIYHHGVAVVTDETSVVQRFGGGASDEVTSVDPHHDRKLSGCLR